MTFCLSATNLDNRKPAPKLFKSLNWLAAGDKGYISKKLLKELEEMGINFITKNTKEYERCSAQQI